MALCSYCDGRECCTLGTSEREQLDESKATIDALVSALRQCLSYGTDPNHPEGAAVRRVANEALTIAGGK